MRSPVVDARASRRVKFYKFSSYLRGRSRKTARVFFAWNIIVPRRREGARLSRDWIFNRFTLAAAASGRAKMNGFTWSAKGDLVPVCCHNAVGNTSPRSTKARRPLYYLTRRREDPPSESGSSATKLSRRLDAALLFILPNDPDKPTIKAHVVAR